MVPITKKKLSQDIVKCIRISPFNEALIATCNVDSVEVINLRTNQAIPIVQKEPVSAISAICPKKHILVSCFFKNRVRLFFLITFSIFFPLHAHRLSDTMKKLEFFTFQINSLKNQNTFDMISLLVFLKLFFGRDAKN